MPTSPSSSTQNPLSIRLYKVLAANFDDDATTEALNTLSELYAPAPGLPVRKAKESKVDGADEDEDDWNDDEASSSAKPINGHSYVTSEVLSGDVAARARKSLRRDVESKLAESSRRFLTAFAEVDKVRYLPFYHWTVFITFVAT